MTSRTLENQLERLLTFGTVLCTLVIAIGVLLDSIDAKSPVNLVAIGVIGFIALPVLRILTMLRHYTLSRDIPMTRVVALVLGLVTVGLILGVMLK